MDLDYTDRTILLCALDHAVKKPNKSLPEKETKLLSIGANNLLKIIKKSFHKLRFTKFDLQVIIYALNNYAYFLSRSNDPESKNKLLDAEDLLEDFQEAFDEWQNNM